MTEMHYLTVDSGRVIGWGYTTDGTLPPGAVMVTAEAREALQQAEADGQSIILDAAGVPAAVPPAGASADDRAAQSYRLAEAAIAGVQRLVDTHRDEIDLGAGTTLTAAQYAALLAWRQAVRAWAAASGWPDVPLPAAPAWLPPN